MALGIHHFGITVSNLDKALHFFHDLLGLPVTLMKEASGERPEILMKMPGIKLRIAILKTDNNQSIELIEYVSPRGKKLNLTTCNYGVPHLALTVNDIGKLYTTLSAEGYTFQSRPYWKGESVAGKGWGVCFVRGPDDIPIELMQPPG